MPYVAVGQFDERLEVLRQLLQQTKLPEGSHSTTGCANG